MPGRTGRRPDGGVAILCTRGGRRQVEPPKPLPPSWPRWTSPAPQAVSCRGCRALYRAQDLEEHAAAYCARAVVLARPW